MPIALYSEVHLEYFCKPWRHVMQILRCGTGQEMRWFLNEIHSPLYAEVIRKDVCDSST